MSPRTIFLFLLCAWSIGCSAPIRHARLDPAAAPSAVEIDAADRARNRSCGPTVGLLWPGIGQACLGRPQEAAILATMAGAELGVGIAGLALIPSDNQTGELLSDSGQAVAFAGVQNLWTYSISRSALDLQLAQWKPYAPQDTLEEMVIAPFNVQVLKRPAVFGGIIGLTGTAVAINAFSEGSTSRGRPNLFGKRLPEPVAYPLAAGLGTVLFQHVAIGEEIAFRGLLQPDLVRLTGSETNGWILSSLIFGGFHAFNALLLPGADAAGYLAYAVPYITVTGAWLGLAFRWSGYSLAPPIAIHFWYDFLLSAADFAMDPKHNVFSAKVAVPF